MSGDSEQLATAREVASELGLGAAMLRRYASTYETVSGDEITVHRRDGRLFTEEKIKVLSQARALVMQTLVDVKTALKQALEQPLQAAPVALTQSSALGSDALMEAFRTAQERANAPLLSELQGIRQSLERLEASQRTESETAAPVSQQGDLRENAGTNEHGLVVRFALWLERVLKR